MSDLRTRIFETNDSTAELVDVPEWGVKLEIRSMDGNQRAEWLAKQMKNGSGDLDGMTAEDIRELYPNLIIVSAFDPETGERVFEPEDAEQLNTRNSAVLERLAQVALRISGLTTQAESALGKGSSATASDASTST